MEHSNVNSPDSTLKAILSAAVGGVISYSLLKVLATQSSRSPAAELDFIAHHVAKDFVSGGTTFESADAIMNAMYSLSIQDEFLAENDRTLPPDMYQVYEAFDAGEYRHRNDGPDVDPVAKYTKPLLLSFLAKHSRHT